MFPWPVSNYLTTLAPQTPRPLSPQLSPYPLPTNLNPQGANMVSLSRTRNTMTFTPALQNLPPS